MADLKVTPANERALRESLARALELGKGVVHVLSDLDALMRAAAQGRKQGAERVELSLHEQTFSTLRACPSCGRSFPELDPRLFSYNSKHGWCAACYGTGLALERVDWSDERARTGTEDHVLDSWIDWLEVEERCPSCDGQRLNPEALAVRLRGQSIAALSAQPIARLAELLAGLRLDGREQEIARDLVAELTSRLGFLADVGLAYLTLDRAAPTLSGGEAQRIRLAAQLGSNLRGVCYILDEPTIGLHPRDNRVLLDVLQRLEAKGNTLVVVEHDEDTIRRASHVIDLGPGAGRLGGRVVAQGSAADLIASPDSVTGRFLAAPLRHPLQPRRAVAAQAAALHVEGATLHNLKRADARVPLARLVAVTGVSGSGKSTLARDVLHDNLVRLLAAQRKTKRDAAPAGCRALKGWQAIERVLEVDQTPIGKTPRSCPATYVGFWDAIRRLFADTTEARMRGYEREPVLVQHRRRALRGLRRPGHEEDRDELPARREGALRSLRRRALQRRDAERALARQDHRRRAGDERRRGGRVLRRAPVDPPRAAPAAGRRPRLPHARPAEPDAVRRRGAAHQAGDRARQGARRRAGSAAARAMRGRGGRRARSTCSTSRPSACTWPTSRS